MSFPVENIRALCKKRGTSLAALERSLGFGNGVIAGWETAKSYPPYDRVSAVAAALGVSIEELTGEKAPASVSESGRPYVDLDTKMIWAPAPVSILAAQYDVPAPVLAEIVGCNTDRASFMIFGTVNPTDEELLRIAVAFCVTPDSLRKGWVPLYANRDLSFDNIPRSSDRSPSPEGQ